MSSTSIDSTRAQTPDQRPRLAAAPPVFATGTPVPGLSSWVLQRKLGGGGFGEVWLATHAWDPEQKPRAVKFCTDPQARHRLVTHEKNVVTRVMRHAGKHPNVVPLLDANLEGEAPWLMYEFVEGGTLAQALPLWRNLNPRKRFDLAAGTLHAIAGALGAFHRFSPPLVHRDMKPHNVLMAGSTPRITDFGIGGVAGTAPTDLGPLTEGARVPSELRAAGTRIYAPPEQLLGSPPSPRDDVYALGIIAFQLLTGDLRAAPGTDAEYELRLLRAPDELIELIVTSASFNPDRRPADAGVWEEVLAGLLERLNGTTVPSPAPDAHPGGERPGVATSAPSGPQAQGSEPPFAEPAEPPPTEPPPGRTERAERAGRPAPTIKTDWRAAALAALPKAAPARKTSNAWVAVATVGVVALLCAAFLLLTPARSWLGLAPLRISGPDTGPARHPGDVREFALPDGPTMTFCWVPAGEAQLGSPAAERDLLRGQFGTAPGWLRDEADAHRGRYRTGGFWMGQYEVTRGDWNAVLAGTPLANPDGQVSTAEKARLPVETVSWNQAQQFLGRLNALGGADRVFGGRGAFVLPSEDDWEYAARGGHGNGRPFYWGAELNGHQANVDGNGPFGTAAKGPNLGRPAPAGSYAAQYPHPWGLCDLHGNVAEWCANAYEGTTARAVRGGSWFAPAHDARAAARGWYGPDERRRDIGFRVCWVPAP